MQTDSFTLYKLIVLFILDNVEYPITNSQISDLILEKNYTNYFCIQQAISELIEADFISYETIRNSSRYKLTDSGKESVSFFSNKIPENIRMDILDYLKQHEFTLRNKNSSIANYYKSTLDEYIVTLSITEDNSTLIDLNLSVPTEAIASKMCFNWEKKSQEIYSYIFKNLL